MNLSKDNWNSRKIPTVREPNSYTILKATPTAAVINMIVASSLSILYFPVAGSISYCPVRILSMAS